MSNTAKQKGSRLEYAVRDLFRKFIDKNCERQVMSGGAPGGWAKGDIHFSYQLPYNPVIECKNQEKYNFWLWWNQAKDQAGQFETPMLVFTKNHQDNIIAMKLEDFMKIYEDLVGYIKAQEIKEQGECEHNKNLWKLKSAISQIKDYLK